MKETSDLILERFKAALAEHGIVVESVDETGLIYLSVGEALLKVSLDNVRRQVERDGNDDAIDALVETIRGYSMGLPEQWEDVRDAVYISLTPNDVDFADFIHEPVTELFDKVYAHYDGTRFSWISAADLAGWGIEREALILAAAANMDRVAAAAVLQVEYVEGRRLLFIAHEREAMKAALLFSSEMRKRIEVELGSPFYAVIPVRDFCYIFSSEDLEFFSPRLGPTVVDEYRSSGYPITTEILAFAEDGVGAIGYYPFEEE